MIWSQVTPRILPYRWSLFLSLTLMLIGSAVALSLPWFGGQIAQGLFDEQTLGISVMGPALLALLLFQTLLQVGQRCVVSATSERLAADLRSELFTHVQRLPLPFVQARRRGDIISLLTREVDSLSHFATVSLVNVLPRILTLFGSVFLMLHIDPILTMPVILGVPTFAVALKLLGRRIRPLAGEMRAAYASCVSLAEQSLSVLSAVKSFTRESLEADRYRETAMQYRDLSLRLNRIEAWLGPILRFASASAVITVLWLASEQVISGALLPGELVTFLLYAAVLTRPVSGLADLWGQFQHAKGALVHMQEILKADIEDLHIGQDPNPVQGHIQFDDLSFAHPARPCVLRCVNLDIPAGMTTAITGENGSGKSTLVDLLLRFQPPDEGRILLDAQDITTLNLMNYRRAIALVPQRIALIDGTIADNIRFGRPHATLDQIETAVREADAWNFVSDLPDGLSTLVGERGIRLSGGQQQRVALARALLMNPTILILDEPTAMFDPDGEKRFVERAKEAFRGKTVILITHRPASLQLADQILEIRNGHVYRKPYNSIAGEK